MTFSVLWLFLKVPWVGLLCDCVTIKTNLIQIIVKNVVTSKHKRGFLSKSLVIWYCMYLQNHDNNCFKLRNIQITSINYPI